MDFNSEQLVAIQSEARNLLVLAGAGTGKTRTIIGRAIHLIEKGTDPSRIAIVTFTRRAASELRSRLSSHAGAPAKNIVTGTFHHLSLRIMSSRRQWFGYNDMTLMDRDDQTHLMKLVRGELVGKDAAIPPAAKLINYYSYARNTNQPAGEYLKKFTELDEQTVAKLLEIFAGYKERKRNNAYLDYDDILHRFAKVLHDDEQIRKKVCSRYDHVLVDEMQDTNPLQWLILQSFAEHCSLFCVGDDAQSIYAFRGADFRNVHSFEDRLPNSETLKLELNYRSTQPILDVANWLLGKSPLEFEKNLRSARGDGSRPCLLDFDSEFEEAEWIVEKIKQRKIQGGTWTENMVLCRTAYSARPIEAELIEQRIPYRFVGGVGLLQMAHVRDLLSAVRTVVNHRDELAWMRYLTLWPKIGEVTAARITDQVTKLSTTEEALACLAERLANRKEIAEVPASVLGNQSKPARAITAAIKALEKLLETKYDNWEARRKDLQLLERLAENHRSLQSFLETYTLDPISASEVTPADARDEGIVTLITVHSAKGTESEACFVAAAQPGNYPHSRSLDDDDSIEEERRVLYVALTRAKDELYISRHLSRGGYGRISWNAAAGAHYFLDGLPTKLVDNHVNLARSPIDHFIDDDVIG